MEKLTLIDFIVSLNQRGRVSGGGRFATPHDSTVGVGAGFYWFSAAFLLFIAVGVLKAFYDEKNWRGRFYRMPERKSQKATAKKPTQ